MAKAPVAGFSKTRLIPALGEQGAAELAKAMLMNTLAHASDALRDVTSDAATDVGIDVIELCVAPEFSDSAWQGLVLPPDIIVTTQSDGHLGKRMALAVKPHLILDDLANESHTEKERVILVGTDCPQLTVERLMHAASALENTDVVMHPVSDGGYALLGLNHYHNSIFENIEWSTDSVAATTLERCLALGWSVTQLDILHDIDEPSDLVYLAEFM